MKNQYEITRINSNVFLIEVNPERAVPIASEPALSVYEGLKEFGKNHTIIRTEPYPFSPPAILVYTTDA